MIQLLKGNHWIINENSMSRRYVCSILRFKIFSLFFAWVSWFSWAVDSNLDVNWSRWFKMDSGYLSIWPAESTCGGMSRRWGKMRKLRAARIWSFVIKLFFFPLLSFFFFYFYFFPLLEQREIGHDGQVLVIFSADFRRCKCSYFSWESFWVHQFKKKKTETLFINLLMLQKLS